MHKNLAVIGTASTNGIISMKQARLLLARVSFEKQVKRYELEKNKEMVVYFPRVGEEKKIKVIRPLTTRPTINMLKIVS